MRPLRLIIIALVLTPLLVATPHAEGPSELRREFLSGSSYEVSIEPPPRPEAEAAEASGVSEASGVAEKAWPGQPVYTLQVGAFRNLKTAVKIRTELLEHFTDIEIVETQSGGESLFRVRVGHTASKEALAVLKRELAKAGYPSFATSGR